MCRMYFLLIISKVISVDFYLLWTQVSYITYYYSAALPKTLVICPFFVHHLLPGAILLRGQSLSNVKYTAHAKMHTFMLHLSFNRAPDNFSCRHLLLQNQQPVQKRSVLYLRFAKSVNVNVIHMLRKSFRANINVSESILGARDGMQQQVRSAFEKTF